VSYLLVFWCSSGVKNVCVVGEILVIFLLFFYLFISFYFFFEVVFFLYIRIFLFYYFYFFFLWGRDWTVCGKKGVWVVENVFEVLV
jgi:hypothetical protein